MAKDLYHDKFRNALIKDGWVITHDPYPLRVGRIGYEVDFGAEKLLAAEKGNQKIAVELKSFAGPLILTNSTGQSGSSTTTS